MKSLFPLALAVLAGTAQARPYATTYTGTIEASVAPEVIAGQRIDVTLVFDNGSNTAQGQSWAYDQLTCVLWRMNDARNAIFAQDLADHPPNYGAGRVNTDATGALTRMFDHVVYQDANPAANYTTYGLATVPDVHWYVVPAIGQLAPAGLHFYDGSASGGSQRFHTTTGQPLPVTGWSAPVAFDRPCNAAAWAPQQSTGVAAVPALGAWGVPLLGGLTGLLGMAVLGTRKRRAAG